MEIYRLKQLTKSLSTIKPKLPELSAIAGFDGFIDTITRPIASGNSRDVKSYFNNIEEFASFISQRAGISSSIELVESNRKIGGNAPIFANALGNLGVHTTCVGAFGYPEADPVFKNISENCRLQSVAAPGTSTALEFNDGKVMLATNGELNSMDWNMIISRAGLDQLRSSFHESQLLGLFNWSETPLAEDIWMGILKDIVPQEPTNKHVVLDFSDCARREKSEILSMLELVKEFGKKASTTISMNENEADAVLCSLGIQDMSTEKKGEAMRQSLFAENIVWHFQDDTLGFSKDGMHYFETYKINQPLLTTGAGDNFNAGLSLGILAGFSLDKSIMTASLTGSYYVQTGNSPSLDELIGFITTHALQNEFQIFERKGVSL